AASSPPSLHDALPIFHAAIGRVQLGRLPEWTARRQELASFFDAHLDGVVTPVVRERATHVYHQYTVRIEGASAAERDEFASALREEHQVGCGVYYPTPVNRLPTFATELDLPVTDRLVAEVLSLPVHPGVSEEDRDRIVQAVNTVAKAGA